ncbi:MAG: hypothetical protein R2722_16350 [Tessaracoccus sp.]
MTDNIQPDLFGDYDRAQERAARWREAARCPSCGTDEPSGYLLSQNHGYEPGEPGISGFPFGGHPIYGAECVAQHLVRNHIIYAIRKGSTDMLVERCERGRSLRLDVDAIVREVS